MGEVVAWMVGKHLATDKADQFRFFLKTKEGCCEKGFISRNNSKQIDWLAGPLPPETGEGHSF